MRLCNTKLTALALAAALPVGAQAADNITLYGKARLSVDFTDTGASNVTKVSDAISRLGVKGTEDLGNGLKAIFQMETGVNMDDGAGKTGTLFGGGRNSFVGLAGGFGTVALGIHDSPYRMSTGKMAVFSDTMGDYRNIIGSISTGGGTKFFQREPNTVNYWSPKFDGLQFRAQYRAGEVSGVNQDRYSLSGTYDSGPFAVGLAYEKHNREGSGGKNDTQGLKAGLGYTFQEKTKLGLVYEKLSESGAATAFDRNAWYASLAHNIGDNTVSLAYGRAGNNALASNTGANFYLAGLSHRLSKRTEVYALYAKTRNDSGAQYGLAPGASSGAVAVAVAGQDPSTFSIGINHDF
ncbi:MAG: porin [Gammaproteobacteria bacterium]|nr:porin [Gammaproteobacteria bacterium]